MTTFTTYQITIAFVISISAGLATALGAMAIFFRKIKYNDRRILSLVIAYASGMMFFVGFIELHLDEGIEEYGEYFECPEGQNCYNYPKVKTLVAAWATFIGGVLFTIVCEYAAFIYTKRKSEVDELDEAFEQVKNEEENGGNEQITKKELGVTTEKTDNIVEMSPKERLYMIVIAIIALSILAIHDFLEGMTTFLVALKNLKQGAFFGVALGLHNIVEGFNGAIIAYVATHSKWKSFFLGTLPGMMEPVGSVIGYFVFTNHYSDLFKGFTFSFVGGVIFYVALFKFYYTALHYDKSNGNYVHLLFFLGMITMVMTEILFKLG